MSENQQRAADYLGHTRCQATACPDCRDLAASFDVAEARGRAELAGRVRELADELTRTPVPVGWAGADAADRLRALADEAGPEQPTPHVCQFCERPLDGHWWTCSLNAGELGGIRVGRSIRLHRDAVNRYLEQHGIASPAPSPHPTDRRTS